MSMMQPIFLLTGQMYPMLMSSVPQAWGTFDRKSNHFIMIVNFFLKALFSCFGHDIVYIELLKVVFSVSNGKNHISPLLPPPGKI